MGRPATNIKRGHDQYTIYYREHYRDIKTKIKSRRHKPKPKPPDKRLKAGHTQMGRLNKPSQKQL
jgi:hypothetical protein